MAGDAVRTLCLMPTFRCTAACSSCGTLSHPRENTWLSPELLLQAVNEAAAAGFAAVSFTGGEPTLAGEHLLAAMRGAALRGMRARLVTNAHWAPDAGAAERAVARFVASGLDEISLSAGDQHARFVPLGYVWHAVRASLNAGVATAIMVECAAGNRITKETLLSSDEWGRLRDDFPHAEAAVIEYFWSPLSPSALQPYPEGATVNRHNVAGRGGCANIFNNITVQANGQVAACCGIGLRAIPELSVGKFGEISLAEAARRAESDPFLRLVSDLGPERILFEAGALDPHIEWENRYANPCQACIRVFHDTRVRRAIEAKFGGNYTAKGYISVGGREQALYKIRRTSGS